MPDAISRLKVTAMKTKLPLVLILLSLTSVSCDRAKPKTKLIYYGFDDRSEKSEDTIYLAQTWANAPPCPHWRATINRKDADYQVLFRDVNITIVDRRGQILYNGGPGVMYLPHGNPNGSGVNICKLTGE
jgi:hypothetical protein